MNFHTGVRVQRGRGIGSLFAGLIRGFTPLARMGLQAGKKLLTSDLAKNIGRTALEGGKTLLKGVAADLIEGNNVRDNAQDNLQSARKKIAATLRGGGVRRGKKRKILRIDFEQKQKIKRYKPYNLLD